MVLRVDGQDLPHPGEPDDDAVGDRQRTAGQAGTRTAGNERYPFAGANPNHCRNLFRADRKHNQRGNDPKTGEPVALISAKLSRLRDQAAFADQPADLPADLIGDPPYGPLTDQLEVGRCHRHRLHSTSSRHFGSATHSMSPRAQHLIPRTERRRLAPITTVALPTEGCRETPEPPTRKRYVSGSTYVPVRRQTD